MTSKKGNGAPESASTSIVPFDRAKLAQAYKQAPRPVQGAMPFLSMDKSSGAWSFGIERTPIKHDALFVVNPVGFMHGYVAWADVDSGLPPAKLGEKMVPASEPMPEAGDTPRGSRGWEPQLGFTVKALDGGLEFIYSSASYGGRKGVLALRDQVGEKLATNDPAMVAVIKLANAPYRHKSYGNMQNPVFAVQRWVTLAALQSGEAKALPKGKRK